MHADTASSTDTSDPPTPFYTPAPVPSPLPHRAKDVQTASVGTSTDLTEYEKVYLRIHSAAQQAVQQMQHVEATIDGFCTGPANVRKLKTYAAFQQAFAQLSNTIGSILPITPADNPAVCPAPPTTAALSVLDAHVARFHAAGETLFADLRKECPRGRWTWRIRPVIDAHLELTCNGQDMPDAVRDWLAAQDDRWTDKTVFCRVPGAVSAALSAGANLAGRVWAPAAAVLQMAAWAADPGAEQMFTVGTALANTFSVRVVSGAFLGVARPREPTEQPPGRWWRAGRVVVSAVERISHALLAGSRAVIRCLGAAGRGTVYLASMTASLVIEHSEAVLALLAVAGVGALVRLEWAPLMALLRLGPVLLQLASNPLAWFGTAAVAAAQANASGMSARHSLVLYRQLVNGMPLLARLVAQLRALIAHPDLQQPHALADPLPAAAITALARVGDSLLQSSAPGISLLTPEQLHALTVAAPGVRMMDLTMLANHVSAVAAAAVATPAGNVATQVMADQVFTEVATAVPPGHFDLIVHQLQVSLGGSMLAAANAVTVVFGYATQALALGSVISCIAASGGLMSGVCVGLAMQYVLRYERDRVQDLLQDLGVSPDAAAAMLSTASTVVSGVTLATGLFHHVFLTSPAAGAAALTERLRNLPPVQITAAEVAQRGERLTKLIARCVSQLTAAGHQLVTEGRLWATDPRVAACVAEMLRTISS